MFGSILYNCWGFLVAFTIYFFMTLSNSVLPSRILISSFIVAIITFFGMFLVRYVMGYILYTPDDRLFKKLNDDNNKIKEKLSNEELQQMDKNHTREFSDESSEDIAQVVRTMMNQES